MNDQEANLLVWEHLAEVHGQDAYYDSASLVGGSSSLIPEEEDALRFADLEDVAGRDVLHLQCHLGFDAITFARRGARVVGVDFSEVALRKAAELAHRCAVDVEWRRANALSLPADLASRFDLVWATVGVVIWIDDISIWMNQVANVLRPGGCLVLLDGHPSARASPDAISGPVRRVVAEGWDYATPLRTGPQVQFTHSASSIISAAEGAGLRVVRTLAHEAVSTDLRISKQELGSDGKYRRCVDGKPVPLFFELIAVR